MSQTELFPKIDTNSLSAINQKETSGFYAISAARVFLVLAVLLLNIFTYQSTKELYIVSTASVVLLIIAVFTMVNVKQNGISDWHFYTGLACDLAILAALPFFWYYAAGWKSLPAAYLTKTMFNFVWLLDIFLYIIPLKPALPAIVGFFAGGVHAGLFLYAYTDSRTQFSMSLLGLTSTNTVVVSFQAVAILCAVFSACISSYVAYIARASLLNQQLAEEEKQSENWGKNGEINAQGTTKTGAVLYADIRSYSELCKSLNANQIFNLLSVFHQVMNGAISDYNAIVLPPSGDFLSCFFENPANAVGAALAMGEQSAELNLRLAQHRIPNIKVDIGIHYGEVDMGLIICQQGQAMAFAGGCPSIAERVSSACKTTEQGLLFTGSVKNTLGESFVCKPVGYCKLKGQDERLELYTTS